MAQEQRSVTDYLALPDERPFLMQAFHGTLADPDRLRYAELVEPRDPERAEWLRLEVALHGRATDDPAVIARFIALGRQIGFDYANLLLRDVILNCGTAEAKQKPRPVRFAFTCTKRWETLAPTDAEAVRFCKQCREPVYYCATIADAETRAYAGQCIAIPKELSNGGLEGRDVLGRPDPVRDWADHLYSVGPGRTGESEGESLVVIYAKSVGPIGRRYVLGNTPREITIGRAADNTFVLDGEGVSRLHARFERRADAWWVLDNRSTNGTYVNDMQVTELSLRDGDNLRIGFTILKFMAARPRGR